MKPLLPLLPLLLGFSVLLGGSPAAGETPAGFTALFNGRDLAGWRGGGATVDPRALLAMPDSARAALLAKWEKAMTEPDPKTGRPNWSVEDGVLVNQGLGPYATTERDYGDFELLADWKIEALGDSGVYLRGVPQVQVWDPDTPDPTGIGYAKGSGGLWNNPAGAPGKDPLVRADRPLGEWNHFRILMVGSRVSVWLNGQRVVDHALLANYYDRSLPAQRRRPILPRGPIQLQTHGGRTWWRNLFIREIGSDEGCRILAEHNGASLQPVFNGRDLEGWAGPLDEVAVEDGAMVWQRGNGTVYWNHDLSDFRARVDFALSPGANNGLAIRYSGQGIPAYDAMCELQILDDNYEKVRGPIDPRQAHGSIYGMVAAARGYQHPMGDWNFQEVTVQGPRITVELNGTIILDADVSKIDLTQVEKVNGRVRPHPGKDRRSGFFGFAGHQDRVKFKDILIEPLAAGPGMAP